MLFFIYDIFVTDSVTKRNITVGNKIIILVLLFFLFLLLTVTKSVTGVIIF